MLYFIKKKRKHREWRSKLIQSWKTSSVFHTLFNELEDENFKMNYRVSREQFDVLIKMITKDIAKIDTNRKAISPEERLAISSAHVVTD